MITTRMIATTMMRAGRLAAIILWIAAVGVGARTLLRYANTPAAATLAPPAWPGRTAIRPVGGRPTLLVFAHPQCSCTRATLGELAAIVAQVGQGREAFDTYVIFSAPAAVPDVWHKTGLWESAVSIPQVRAVVDRGGAEARRFHATTSGQTFLYSGSGRLLFGGGITAARGHAGPNDGHDALVALLGGSVMRGAPWHKATPVYGCSLLVEESP